LLDGVLVAGALFIISWLTALGTTVHASGDSWFALGASSRLFDPRLVEGSLSRYL